jgi:hypothetical protein
MRLTLTITIFALSRVPVAAQVFSSEFFYDPVSEGWTLFQQYCEPEVWNDGGLYYQQLDFKACGPPPPPGGGQDEYVIDIDEFNGSPAWFYEFRVMTNGDRSEIPGNAPTAISAFNFFGESYKVNIARDQVKLLSDNPDPVIFVDVTPDVFHTVRLELFNVIAPTYIWYVNGVIVGAGLANGSFPSDDARLTWRGRAWFEPCENAWDYIRYGVIPIDHSGDFDSDSDLDLRDFYYLADCITQRNNAPNQPADPGCQWADMDADNDVDLADWGVFQQHFTGSSE